MNERLDVACFCGTLNCQKHKRQARRETRHLTDQNRKDDPHRAIYQMRQWRDRTRPAILARDRLCKIAKLCVARYGVPMPSTDVDHIIPIRAGGDPWDENNLQGACHSDHAAKTAAEKSQLNAYNSDHANS